MRNVLFGPSGPSNELMIGFVLLVVNVVVYQFTKEQIVRSPLPNHFVVLFVTEARIL